MAVVYTLYWGTNSEKLTHSNSCSSIQTGLVATGLVPNQVYYFAASLTAADGRRSKLSPTIVWTNPPGAIPKAMTPAIVKQPSCASALIGGRAQFAVTATGALSYRWYKDGTALVDGGGFTGSRTATLTVSPVSVAEVADYNVVVANAAGSSTSSVVALTAVATPTVSAGRVSAAVPGQLPRVSGNLGQAVTLSVAVSNNAPVFYQWQHNGKNIAGATGAQLVISAVTDKDAGGYSVIVSTGLSSVTNVLSGVLTVVDPPVITRQPASQTDKGGATVVFTVAGTGTAPIVFEWYKDGVPLHDGGNIAGATGARLVVGAISETDAGSYVAVLTNAAGVATSVPAMLTVAPLPVKILSQPGNEVVRVGQTAVWGVYATGTPPLAYQWTCDGTNTPGATGRYYYINAVVSSEEGSYSVVVSNDAGAARSVPATLKVVP